MGCWPKRLRIWHWTDWEPRGYTRTVAAQVHVRRRGSEFGSSADGGLGQCKNSHGHGSAMGFGEQSSAG